MNVGCQKQNPGDGADVWTFEFILEDNYREGLLKEFKQSKSTKGSRRITWRIMVGLL